MSKLEKNTKTKTKTNKKKKKPCLLHSELDSFIEPGKEKWQTLTVEYEMASIRVWDG